MQGKLTVIKKIAFQPFMVPQVWGADLLLSNFHYYLFFPKSPHLPNTLASTNAGK